MPDTGHQPLGVCVGENGQFDTCTSSLDEAADEIGMSLCPFTEDLKTQLDHLNDRDFMAAVMRMGQEEKEALMVSEAERLRTYRSLWPNPPFIDYRYLAKEGFYYIGCSDRVQCCFCAGILGNWEKEDKPNDAHRKYFSHCPMAQGKESRNIELPASEDSGSFSSTPPSKRADALPKARVESLGIDTSQPKHPNYRVYQTRLGSYRSYPGQSPMSAEELCEAGFYYEGPGDKVRCFWCDGALELWSPGDDAWDEHAKWYPGCSFVQMIQGLNYIRWCRSQLSTDDLEAALELQYNSTSTKFLSDDESMNSEEVTSFSPPELIETTDFILNDSDAIDEELATTIVAAMTCTQCRKNEIGAVLRPCGHHSICQECSETNNYPARCHQCNAVVKDSIKVFRC